MIDLHKILAVVLFVVSTQLIAGEIYQPESGDTQLDEALLQLNKKLKNKEKQFTRKSAIQFQVQIEKVSDLFRHYEFTVADVLMTLSIADVSGQPVNNISRAYFENKKSGWKYVLEQLEINNNSIEFKRIKNDAIAEFLNRKLKQ